MEYKDSQPTIYARQWHSKISNDEFMARMGYCAGWKSEVDDERAKFRAYGINFHAYFMQIEGGVRLSLRAMKSEIDKTVERDFLDATVVATGKLGDELVSLILQTMVIQSVRDLSSK